MSLIPLLLSLAVPEQTFTVNNYPYDGPLHRPANARLVWRDKFHGRSLDLGKWAFDTSRNKDGWWNGERQYYSAGRRENLRLKNGPPDH